MTAKSHLFVIHFNCLPSKASIVILPCSVTFFIVGHGNMIYLFQMFYSTHTHLTQIHIQSGFYT